MSKKLIITEKPSVARDFARVLKVSGRQDGYLENEEYVISWCVGHLVGLVYPEDYDEKFKKWRLEDLPFLPKDYKYNVIESVAKQYEIVHGLLHRDDIDVVYWAGDAGKEGQTIEENIRNFGGVREGMQELRVWIDSQTDEELLRGIREAKDMAEYANLGKSGIMRTIEDYAMGINFSRVMSVRYGNLLNKAADTKSYTAIAVGRVMTCVLGMVVIREREIRNFKETPFYRVVGNFENAAIEGEWKAIEGSKYFDSPLLYKENGFKKEEDALCLIDELKEKQLTISELDKSTSKKRAPFLFNLAELQAECSKRFKISPDETLAVAQSLYEKKLTTYPRTDARVLTTAIAKEISKNIRRLETFTPVSGFVNKIMTDHLYANIAKTSYTDDSKVTDHYAIIPTGQLSELSNLNPLERQIFELIVRRFLAIFYPSAEYETVKMTISLGDEKFFSSGKVLKSLGYLEVMGKTLEDAEEESSEDENDKKAKAKKLLAIVDSLQVGQELSLDELTVKEGKTSPPKRYTSGSMVLAMENAGQLIEEEELREQIKGSGIGTSATRAEIIQKLVRIGYLHLNKKSQVLSPENLGEMVFEVVSLTVPALLNPKMTASWEKGLDGITNGTVDFDDYRQKLEQFIREETNRMKEMDLRNEIGNRIIHFAADSGKQAVPKAKIGIKCPKCSGELTTTPFGFGCENYQKDGSGCDFAIGSIASRNLTIDEVRQLLEEGQTPVLNGFVSKGGKKFSAALKLEKNEGEDPKITFDFDNVENKTLPDVTCPKCGGKIQILPFGYGCENHNRDGSGCSFVIGTIAGKKLSQKQAVSLLTEGKTEVIEGFESKSGKKFSSVLKLTKDEETGEVNIGFDFDDKEAYYIDGFFCPVCHSPMVKTSFGFGCSNYDASNPESCKFNIGSICSKSLTLDQAKQLVNEGRTETIRGFKSKAGKKFDACLVFKMEEGRPTITFDFEHVEAKKVRDAVCPICGKDIVVTSFGYACENYHSKEEDSCSFAVGKIASVKIKEAQLRQLLTDGKTDLITGFKSKAGKKFDAMLKLEEGQIKFSFPDEVTPTESNIPCPVCGYKLIHTKYYYECACGFKISHMVASKDLDESIIKELLDTGKTADVITGFTGKSGNTFDARLVYEKESGISFSFDDFAAKEDNSVFSTEEADKVTEQLKQEESISEEPISDESISEESIPEELPFV